MIKQIKDLIVATYIADKIRALHLDAIVERFYNTDKLAKDLVAIHDKHPEKVTALLDALQVIYETPEGKELADKLKNAFQNRNHW